MARCLCVCLSVCLSARLDRRGVKQRSGVWYKCLAAPPPDPDSAARTDPVRGRASKIATVGSHSPTIATDRAQEAHPGFICWRRHLLHDAAGQRGTDGCS